MSRYCRTNITVPGAFLLRSESELLMLHLCRKKALLLFIKSKVGLAFLSFWVINKSWSYLKCSCRLSLHKAGGIECSSAVKHSRLTDLKWSHENNQSSEMLRASSLMPPLFSDTAVVLCSINWNTCNCYQTVAQENGGLCRQSESKH